MPDAHPHPHEHGPTHAHEHGPAHAHGPSRPGPLADAAVRTGRTTDAPAVGFVQAFVYQHDFAGILPAEALAAMSGPQLGSLWRRSLEQPPSPRHRLLVATAGDTVVGYAALGPAGDEPGLEAATTGMIYEGGVHPEGRGSGHGSRLLNAAVDTLRAGAPAGTMDAVATWVPAEAEGTRAFLQAAGFAPDGAWRDRVVDDAGGTVREVRLVASLDEP